VWSSRFASALALGLALAAPAQAGAAAPPRVQAQLVTRAGKVFGPRTVALAGARVNGCRLAAGLPVDALAALRSAAGAPAFRANGGCSSLYVFQVGSDRARGVAGWVYKVGRRLPDVGASDPSARLHGSQQVTWFWCVDAASCQRTLEVRAPARVTAGARVTVTVTAYDDHGRGVPATGATVALGSARGTAGSGGRVTLTAPARRGRVRVSATERGLVPAFPREVSVG